MEKLIVLALLIINVHLVAGACSNETRSACDDNYHVCAYNAEFSLNVSICACYGDLLICLRDNNCLNETEYQSAVQSCIKSCLVPECTSGTNAPIESPPIPDTTAPMPVPFCDHTMTNPQICNSLYDTCLKLATYKNYCACYGQFLYCNLETGCFSENKYQNSILQCVQQRQCSVQECNTQRPVTPPSACHRENSKVCYDSYQSCVSLPGNNATDNCACFGSYMRCLYDIECLSSSQYQDNTKACVQSGCGYEQCNTANRTPFQVQEPIGSISSSPVSEPITSTPSSSSDPVGAPVSAPIDTSSVSTPMISLEHWELGLMIVGLLFAGIGIAAIIGVVIYLSRRSSAKKATNYADSQQYYALGSGDS